MTNAASGDGDFTVAEHIAMNPQACLAAVRLLASEP